MRSTQLLFLGGEEGLPPGPDLGLGWRQGEGEGEVILLLSMI